MTSSASVEGRERLRLFCALRLPDDILDALVAWQGEHVPGGRVVPREHLHITLAFLGSRPAGELRLVVEALRSASAGVGAITLAPVDYRETRSVGMLVLEDAGGEAARLATSLFGGLEGAGVYERERRPWLPHVTVVRFRTRARLAPPLPRLEPFRPSDAAVYMSVLRPSGAQYEALETVALGG